MLYFLNRIVRLATISVFLGFAQEYHPPAENRYAQVSASGSILPGGRVIQPLGTQLETGPGAFGIAVSPKGAIGTADIGFERFGVTRIEQIRTSWSVGHWWARTPGSHIPELADPAWTGVSYGIAFDSEHGLWISEGNSGRLRLLDTRSGNHEKIIDLNQGDWQHSFTADLAFDPPKRLLYVLDRTNSRMVIADAKKMQILASFAVGRTPFALALAPDSGTVYVSDAGAFDDPESNSLCIIDVRTPSKPALIKRIPTGDPDSTGRTGGSAPSGVLATGDRVYVADARDDSITVISGPERTVSAKISLRVKGLEHLRGIMPGGMAFDPLTKWLLVAEAGINAVAVVDTESNRLLGHIPVGWFPARVAIAGDRAYVTNVRGRGTGPHLRHPLMDFGEVPALHRGSVSSFVIPAASDLPKLTGTVYAANGLLPDNRGGRPELSSPLPAGIQNVVLIVKENRSFDEILGDLGTPGPGAAENGTNRRVQAVPQLARFGLHGFADGKRRQFSLKDIAVTPNHHAIARQWAFSDNFYANSEGAADGRQWLAGVCPDFLSITRLLAAFGSDPLPETDVLGHHLERNGIRYRKFGDGADFAGSSTDQVRAERFIAEMEARYGKGTEPLPQLITLRLPNDRLGPETQDGLYPYEASYMADNDLALGRVLQYLSRKTWWRKMAVFVTEASADGGLDHIDSHRTLLLAAGPWVRRDFVSHTNADYSALLRTIFQILHLPPLNLMDATAASLRDLFTSDPDYSPYNPLDPDPRIFSPAK